MAKAEKTSLDIKELIQRIKEEASSQSEETYIPDIITFCESDSYLGMKKRGAKLFPMQKIILSCFYRGQQGNENLKLSEEELALLHRLHLHDVIEKYYSNEKFRELILVLGRRSGKGVMTGLMACYEAMKLLELPGGDPFRYYGLESGNPIYILTVAVSSDQARLLFNQVKDSMMKSEYFRTRIGWTEADKIYLKTLSDRRQEQSLLKEGFKAAADRVKGSVVIMSGHSNSESLLGKRYFALLLDEVASFKNTGGPTSGDRIYSALGPGTADFKRISGYTEDGTPIQQTESKIISISSPRSEQGMLFRLYSDTSQTAGRIAFRLPTWKVNEMFNEDGLRAENKYMSATEFAMEFGAEFSGTAGEKFIPDQYIDQSIEMGRNLGLRGQTIQGVRGIVYYAHLDPATTSHNYALVVLHVEERRRRVTDPNTGNSKVETFKMFVIDHIKAWHPTGSEAIKVAKVENYVIDLSKRFKLVSVTYDAWQSISSIQNLRAKGIPTRMTPFRSQYKVHIYESLEHLLVANHIALPASGEYTDLLENELKCLKRRFTSSGFKIGPDPEARTKTDDMCDALAGAIGAAIEGTITGYPQGVLVNLPISPSSGNQQWRIGTGMFTPNQFKMMDRQFGYAPGRP